MSAPQRLRHADAPHLSCDGDEDGVSNRSGWLVGVGRLAVGARLPQGSLLLTGSVAILLALLVVALLRRLCRSLAPQNFGARAVGRHHSVAQRLAAAGVTQGQAVSLRQGAAAGSDADDAACPRTFSISSSTVPFLRVDDESMPAFERQLWRVHTLRDDEEAGARRPSVAPLLETLRQAVPVQDEAEGQHKELEARIHEPFDDIFLAKVLLACNLDVKRAVPMVNRVAKWRHAMGGGMTPTAAWCRTGIILVPFEDRCGRPVIVLRARHYSQAVPMALMERGLLATLDTVITHLLQGRGTQISSTNPLEQYVLAFDAAGAGWRNFSCSVLQMAMRTCTDKYPDALAQVFVLSCNATIRKIWQWLSPFLPARTQKKVKLVAPEEVPSFMRDLLGSSELLPPSLGGTAAPWAEPCAGVCGEPLSLEARVGALAAATWRRHGIVPASLELPPSGGAGHGSFPAQASGPGAAGNSRGSKAPRRLPLLLPQRPQFLQQLFSCRRRCQCRRPSSVRGVSMSKPAANGHPRRHSNSRTSSRSASSSSGAGACSRRSANSSAV